MVDTLMNIKGNPAFLRAETIDGSILIPPFIEVIKDVTSDETFTSKNLALKNYSFETCVTALQDEQ